MTNALGIDVSSWQDDNSTPQQMNFAKSKAAGAEFVFIKSSQARWCDQDFIYNWQAAKDAGILRGAYHFLDWTKPAEQQADFFSGLLAKDPGEIPPTLDYEYRTGVPSAGSARLECKAFLERVKANLNLTCMIYTGPDYWKNYGSADAYWKQYPLWIGNPYNAAPWVPLPWKEWTFWQYSWLGDGLLFGAESKGLDMDWYNGDSAKLHAAFGGVTPVPVPVPLTLDQRVSALEAQAKAHGWTV